MHNTNDETTIISLLKESIVEDDINKFKSNLYKLKDINCGDSNGITLLHHAAKLNNLSILKILIEEFKSVIDVENFDKQTPLHIAAIAGNIEVVEYLISKAADVMLASSSGQNVLHYAAHYGKYEIIVKILDSVSDYLRKELITSKDKDGKRALHYAAFHPNKIIVETLIQRGAEPNIKNSYGYTPLHFAANRNSNPEVTKALIEAGAKTNKVNINGDTALILAIKFKNYEHAQIISDQEFKGYEGEINSEVNKYLKLGNSKFCHGEEKCLNDYEVALSLAQEKKDLTGVAYVLIKLGDYFLYKEDYPKAAKIYSSARVFINQHKEIKTIFPKGLFEEKQLSVESGFIRRECGDQQAVPEINFKVYINRLVSIRRKTSTSLERNDETAKNLLKEITKDLSSILSDILRDSLRIIGNPPCQYSVVGLGSMSREEMSPYSDIEFAILVEKKDKKIEEYFIKLSKLIELKVISLGETRFPILLKGIKSITNDGFCLDTGGNTPLGKQELIGTVEELTAYQNPIRFKEDLILSNILRNVCLIQGNKKLFTRYVETTQKVLLSTTTETWLEWLMKKDKVCMEQALYLMSGDMIEFTVNLGKKRVTDSFNVKKELYRLPNNFIGYLSLYFGIEKQNSWDRLDVLLQQKIITKEAYKNISRLLEFATKMRIRTHLFYKQEREDLHHKKMIQEDVINGIYEMDNKEIKELEKSYNILIPIEKVLGEFVANSGKLDFRNKSFIEEGLYVQGRIAEKNLNYTLAKELYIKALNLNPSDITLLKSIANMLYNLGECEEARIYYEQALVIVEKKHGQQHPYYADFLSNFATILSTLGLGGGIVNTFSNVETQQKTLGYYSQTLTIIEDTYGEKHPEYAIVLNNMGSIFQAQNQYDKALDCFKQALIIIKKAYGKEHPEYINSLNQIGSIFQAQNQYNKALDYYKEALTIIQKVYGEEHLDYTTSLNNIASILQIEGQHEDALNFYKQVLFINNKLYGEEHNSNVIILNNIISVLQIEGRSNEASVYYKQSLAIKKETFGKKELNYTNTASRLYAEGHYEEALNCYKQALIIIQKEYGKNHPDYLDALNNIASILYTQGWYDEALNYYRNALYIIKNINDINKEQRISSSFVKKDKSISPFYVKNIVKCLYSIAGEFSEKGLYNQAVNYYKQALITIKTTYGEVHPAYVKCLNNIASMFYAQRCYEEAINYYKQALIIIEKTYGEEHPVYVKCLNNIAAILHTQGRYDEVLAYNANESCYRTKGNGMTQKQKNLVREMIEEKEAAISNLKDNRPTLSDKVLELRLSSAQESKGDKALIRFETNPDRREIFRCLANISCIAMPLSQALRIGKSLSRQAPFNIHEGEDYFSYLPIELMARILLCLPESKPLHADTIIGLLNILENNRKPSRTEVDELLQSPRQLGHLDMLSQQREYRENTIEGRGKRL
ncbi:tetratricopeptide repeat protein [Holosporaceae bacterium 'Namur']|nr:tetratricopeptide repeat protein [Holosporaceae bacterium 'Namur']